MADTSRLRPIRIPVTYPLISLNDSHVSVCLIVADPQRQYKEIVASADFSESLRPRIGRVIGYSKLKAKFSQYEAQRSLYASHDVFLADDRIVNRLPKVLGKTFYKNTTKRPIPIVISPRDAEAKRQRQEARKVGKKGEALLEAVRALPAAKISAEIEKALGSALLHLAPSVNATIKIGFASWPVENLAKNAQVVIQTTIEKYIPKKWNNVRALYLKGPETTALPVWMAEELWVDEKSAVAELGQDKDANNAMKDGKLITSEKQNIKKKRKSLDKESHQGESLLVGDTVTRPVRKKIKTNEQYERKIELKKLTASRKGKLKREKLIARESIN